MAKPIFITADKLGTPYLVDTNYFTEGKAGLFSFSQPPTATPVQTTADYWPVLLPITDIMYPYHWDEFVTGVKYQLPEFFL